MKSELLQAPFEDKDVRSRQESGKPAFEYIKGGDVVKRMIEATENTYDWIVTRMELITTAGAKGPVVFWLCEGNLTIPGMGTRTGIGSAKAFNEDAPKSAETDAYKRACVKFGPGLQLYCEIDEWAHCAIENKASSKDKTAAQIKREEAEAAKAQQSQTSEPPRQKAGDPATEAQKEKLVALITQKGSDVGYASYLINASTLTYGQYWKAKKELEALPDVAK
jgi:hypothetical protein